MTDELKHSARRYHALVIKHMASAGQVKVAESLGMTESMISRFINDDVGIERACLILAAVGLKVVPVNDQVVCESMYGAVVTIAAGAMSDPEIIHKLLTGRAE